MTIPDFAGSVATVCQADGHEVAIVHAPAEALCYQHRPAPPRRASSSTSCSPKIPAPASSSLAKSAATSWRTPHPHAHRRQPAVPTRLQQQGHRPSTGSPSPSSSKSPSTSPCSAKKSDAYSNRQAPSEAAPQTLGLAVDCPGRSEPLLHPSSPSTGPSNVRRGAAAPQTGPTSLSPSSLSPHLCRTSSPRRFPLCRPCLCRTVPPLLHTPPRHRSSNNER
jgi:hypothetical protein